MNPAAQGWHLHPQLADDTHPVAHLDLCELRLMDDANHPWLVLVPRVEDAVEWTDLDEASQARLNAEINLSCRALQQVFRPHKLNVAALGNLVSQLHIHVIARFENDIAWPRPVWGTATAKPYSPEFLIERIERLQAAIPG
ncbi:HIT domain-containing protein [Lysobacter sp. F6437]|uniref:HIT domain-containing protein n=1 Tax=Lysobacter sp. F6437 TaxID=3459296 RepID=UPI00403D6629